MREAACELCGCVGNETCGHEMLDEERMCTLCSVNGQMVCPCCVIDAGHMKEPEDPRQMKLESLSDGQRGE
jgi:hypothetical protein